MSRILNEVIDIVPEPLPYQLSDLLSAVTGGVNPIVSSGSTGLVDSSGLSVGDTVESTVGTAVIAAVSDSTATVSSAISTSSVVGATAGVGSVSVACTMNNMVHHGQSQLPSVASMMSSGQNTSVNVVASSTGMGMGGVLSSVGNANSMARASHINEKQAAINEIEKSLRQCEKVGNYSGSPPAYPHAAPPNKFLTGGGGRTTGNGPLFPNNGLGNMTAGLNNNNINNSGSGGVGQFSLPSNYAQRPVGIAQQRMQMGQLPRYQNIQQQQQRDRLLQEQKNQQLVVHSNATTGLSPGLADMSSLINNTVAPNVSLQRNNSAVRETQLSPGFNSSAFQQMSPGQNRPSGVSGGPPFSPVQMGKAQNSGAVGGGAVGPPIAKQSPQGPPPNYQSFTGGAEVQPMSPQFGTPDMLSLLNMGKTNVNANGNGGVLAQQLSPRQPTFSSPPSQQQWTQQQLSLQQQQNPMLNAQLTVSK